jgi:preprotein translocase subunit SecY
MSGPRSSFDDPDLRRQIFFTLGALALFRVGTFVPVPGVDPAGLKALVDAQSGGPLGFLNTFSGGALGRFSLFSLGVTPYVNASIIVGLLKVGQGRRERGDAARRLTFLLALLQSFGLAFALARRAAPGGVSVVADPDCLFYVVTVLTLTAGALFVMWLCEEITESGLGGGALLIVFAGLVGNILPGAADMLKLVRLEELGLSGALAIVAALLAALMSAVWVETAQRKLAVHYAQRVVGRRMYGGSQSFLPLKLDQSGVVSAVSAAVCTASLAALLLAAAPFFPQDLARRIPPLLNRGSWLDDAVYAALILFFCSLPGAAPIDPNALADQLKKSGGSMPGIRPGDSTAKHIQWVHERLALGGALSVAALAVLPDLLRRFFRLPFFFDGIPLLVVVGVALDAMGRVEAHGIRRTYAKFLK